MVASNKLNKTEKTYTLVHPKNKIEIQCSERYLLQWMSRGFNVKSISGSEIDRRIEQIERR